MPVASRRMGRGRPAPMADADDFADLASTMEFHQLVVLLQERLGEEARDLDLDDPANGKIRFRAARSLAFQAQDVSSVTRDPESGTLEVRVNFLGLYGPSSPLPPHFTERVIESDATRDPLEDLLDIFNHRLIALLHGIWLKFRFHLRFQPGGVDVVSTRLLTLAGLLPDGDAAATGGLPRTLLLANLPLFGPKGGSAGSLSTLIHKALGIDCRIESFVQRTIPVPPDGRPVLGRHHSRLGRDIVLGSALTERSGKFRIHLGPASFDALQDLMPGGARYELLHALVDRLDQDGQDFDFGFHFDDAGDAPHGLGACQLSRSSWLGRRSAGQPIIIGDAASHGHDRGMAS